MVQDFLDPPLGEYFCGAGAASHLTMKQALDGKGLAGLLLIVQFLYKETKKLVMPRFEVVM